MSAFKSIAQRIANAETTMIETIMTIADLSQADAAKAFATLVKVKAVKLDAVGGRYTVKHGAFMSPDVLRRAAAQE